MALVRTAFPFPARTPSWFAGHMARSLRELPGLLDEVDMVVEARDARLPLTSVNPAFDSMLERVWGHSGVGLDRKGMSKRKLVVYTKRDLAEQRYEAPLKKAFMNQTGQRVLFADSRVDADVKQVLRVAATMAREAGETLTELKVLVVGMPNVGKSSLLNGLRRVGVRKGKAFTTGAMPGVTRRLTGTVKIYDDPKIYVFDTPGVMMPFLGHSEAGSERGLKLAITAGIKDGLFEPDAIADYLLYKLNLRLATEATLAEGDKSRHECYTSHLPFKGTFERTDDLSVFLDELALRLGAILKGGERNTEASMAFFLKQFREGKLGRWTLDDLDGVESAFISSITPDQPAPGARIELLDHNGLPITVSDMGAVGSTSEAAFAEATAATNAAAAKAAEDDDDFLAADIPMPPTLPETLQDRVSLTVARFLEQAAEERAAADAGRNKSATQVRKAQREALSQVRDTKRKAKYESGGSFGGKSSSGRPSGKAKGRPSGRGRSGKR